MVITALLTMIGLGVFFAAMLAVANQKLKVEEDPLIEELARALPGLNCGACGFPSCHEFAKALVQKKEEAMDTVCRVAGPETMEIVSKISGVAKAPVKKLAVVFCGAEEKEKTRNAVYKGIATCLSADIIFGGGLNCRYGCLGLGDCMRACPFDAIKMADGLPRIRPNKCVACGKCVKACPRDIIELLPYNVDNLVVAACRSKDAASIVRKICSVGCIACKICEKLSGGVFTVKDNLSKLDIGRIRENIDWDGIIKKCPTNTIVRLK